jgi:hypothetical protein
MEEADNLKPDIVLVGRCIWIEHNAGKNIIGRFGGCSKHNYPEFL